MGRIRNALSSETQYINEIKEIPLLTENEEKDLFTIYKNTGDNEIRNKLIKHNLRLVVSIAKHYSRFDIPFLDIIQMGNLGLVKAVDNFDVDKGYKFSSYATPVIKTSIDRGGLQLYSNTTAPEYIHYIAIKVNNEIRNFKEQYGYEPSDEYLSETLGESIERIERARNIFRIDKSLNEVVGDDSDDDELINFISDPKQDSFVDKIVIENDLLLMLEILNDKEKDVIIKRYGLNDTPIETRAVISKKYGVSIQRIEQMEYFALKKMRRHAYVKGIHKEYK